MKPPAPVTSTRDCPVGIVTPLSRLIKRTWSPARGRSPQGSRSGRSGSLEHDRNRSEKDPHIESHGPFVDVLEIEPDPIVEGQIVPPADLPETGEPGPNAEAPHQRCLGEAMDVPGRQRPGSHQ